MKTRPALLAMLAALTLAPIGADAAAQDPDYEAIVRIMRECARIADITARVTCYDNTVGAERLIASGQAIAPPAPPSSASSSGPASILTPAVRAEGFGAESLPPEPASPDKRAGQERAVLRVSEVRELGRGVYRLTLDDGAVWQFTDAVPFSYSPPTKGDTVEIRRAALGSFVLDYAGQRGVRVQRTR